MGDVSISTLVELIDELVLPFYQIERDLLLPIEPRRDETDAEHSWSMALIGCALAPHIDPTLDLGKVAHFAIVHDLVEIYAGDVSVWDSENLEKKSENEARAAKQLGEKFKHLPWIAETVKAYERKDTNEARYIWALDKLVPFVIRHLDKGKAYVDRGLTKKDFEAGLVENRRKAHAHPGVARLYEEVRKIFDEHPEYFSKEK